MENIRKQIDKTRMAGEGAIPPEVLTVDAFVFRDMERVRPALFFRGESAIPGILPDGCSKNKGGASGPKLRHYLLDGLLNGIFWLLIDDLRLQANVPWCCAW